MKLKNLWKFWFGLHQSLIHTYQSSIGGNSSTLFAQINGCFAPPVIGLVYQKFEQWSQSELYDWYFINTKILITFFCLFFFYHQHLNIWKWKPELSLPVFLGPGVPKKLYIILNLHKLTLRHDIWKIFSRYKKPSLRNIFAKFRSDITTLSVFIKTWIYQVK